MSAIPITPDRIEQPWVMPSRGVIGMSCLIVAESAIFIIFIVAYIFYIGKSLTGPNPREVLELPIFGTICLLSSSITVHFAVAALRKHARTGFLAWLAGTVILGSIFLIDTGMEWQHLIYVDHLTVHTNLFGTTFYSLVGLHASHVIVGLLMLTATLIFGMLGRVHEEHESRLEVLSLYWHFVDAVWVVVFTVVYIVGR